MRLVFAAVIAVTLAGCGGGGDKSAAGSAEQAITGFSGVPTKVNGSFFAIHRHLRERPAELQEAALKHLEHDDPGVRYAALYALALSADGSGVDELRRFAKSDNDGERLLAAGSLLRQGDKQAIPILIEALASAEPLPYRAPTVRAWELARALLVRYTAKDFGLREATAVDEARRAQEAWRSWWTRAGPSLRFDPVRRLYEASGS